MSLRRRLFGLGRRILNASSGGFPFPESLDFSLTSWSQLPETGVVKTANAVDFVATNQGFIRLDTKEILPVGNWYVEFVLNSLSDVFNLISDEDIGARYLQVRPAKTIRVVGTTVFTGTFPTEVGKLIRVVSTPTEYQVYQDEVLVDSFGDGGTVDMNIDIIGAIQLSASTAFSGGSLSYLNLNGTTVKLTEGVGDKVYLSNGVVGTFATLGLGIPTWLTGVDTITTAGTQTALIGYSKYDYADDVNATHITLPTPTTPTTTLEVKVLYLVESYAQHILGTDTSNRLTIDNGGRVRFQSGGISSDYTDVNLLNTVVTIRYQSNGADMELYINGSLASTFIGVSFFNITDIFGVDNFVKPSRLLIICNIDGIIYSTSNNWLNGVKSGGFSDYISPEAVSGFDILGQEISSPLLPNGFNFTGQLNHHVDLTAITPNGTGWIPVGTPVAGRVTRNSPSGDTDVFCIKTKSANPLNREILSDGTLEVIRTSGGLLRIVYGSGFTTAAPLTVDEWVFVCHTVSNVDGTRTIYIGSDTVAPTVLISNTVTFPAISTKPMIMGNADVTTGLSLDGYETQYGHLTKLVDQIEVLKIWNSIKSNMK